MTLALIADDAKKELMVQICIAYKNILGKHRLMATDGTGQRVREVTGLEVERLLGGKFGGTDQIAAAIACKGIDALFHFRGPVLTQTVHGVPDHVAQDLLRLCDMHFVPVATNLPTAELIITALERGDLEWRKYI
ncbi:MAG: methylglyoxal synthase [Oscillospiraceae bacterium]|jgi:methylglyoxal synthase|nr:methylglyoxal synthase [Oscillospiraceae bacterium]